MSLMEKLSPRVTIRSRILGLVARCFGFRRYGDVLAPVSLPPTVYFYGLARDLGYRVNGFKDVVITTPDDDGFQQVLSRNPGQDPIHARIIVDLVDAGPLRGAQSSIRAFRNGELLREAPIVWSAPGSAEERASLAEAELKRAFRAVDHAARGGVPRGFAQVSDPQDVANRGSTED